jgi:hypothetical protein
MKKGALTCMKLFSSKFSIPVLKRISPEVIRVRYFIDHFLPYCYDTKLSNLNNVNNLTCVEYICIICNIHAYRNRL